MLARLHSQPITERIQSISLKSRLSLKLTCFQTLVCGSNMSTVSTDSWTFEANPPIK